MAPSATPSTRLSWSPDFRFMEIGVVHDHPEGHGPGTPAHLVTDKEGLPRAGQNLPDRKAAAVAGRFGQRRRGGQAEFLQELRHLGPHLLHQGDVRPGNDGELAAPHGFPAWQGIESPAEWFRVSPLEFLSGRFRALGRIIVVPAPTAKGLPRLSSRC